MELFSRMSTEALQAIDETRQEMKKNIKENVTASQGPVTNTKSPSMEMDTPNPSLANKDQKTDDTDSAIGTGSMRSNPVIVGEASASKTTSPMIPPDKSRPLPKRMFHVMTDEEIKERHESRHPSLRPSQFAQECIQRHMPLAAEPAQTKKQSVFERLSTPATISYKPTARQRARARLSLSLSHNTNKQSYLAFGQRREPGVRRDSLKSAFPTVLRSMKEEGNIRITGKTEINKRIMINNNKPKHTGYPSLSKSYAKLELCDKPPTPRDDYSDDSIAEVQGNRLHTARQFEITPMGYDSRYLALRYDQPLYSNKDFEECEIIQQSKEKCQQWLAQQTTILTNS
ncbi:uncharacterized protein [Watersipora subatra]|uniref:uncharacterized protein n=1 Tax=Watersipora subatra TaxID=2589382 RepID=UPI00355C6888